MMLGEMIREILVIIVFIVVILAAAVAVFISVAIVFGIAATVKDELERRKMARLEIQMMEQAEKGLQERERDNG